MPGRTLFPPEQQGPQSAAAAVAIFVVAGWLLSRWPGDRHWLTTVLTYAPQSTWSLLPLAALIWAVGTRCWPAVALDAVILAVALFGPGGIVLQRPATPAPGDLRVASQNLFGNAAWSEEFDLDRWRDCDILCLQETSPDDCCQPPEGYDTCVLGELRTAVRGRIVRTEPVSPGVPGLPPALACEVEIDGRQLAVLNVHVEMSQPGMSFDYLRRLWPDYLRHTVRMREYQFLAYRRWIDAQDLPVIVAGDFNTPPASRFYQQMATTLTDCFAATGRGPGYTYIPHGIPVFRIDYVWAGRGVRPVSCITAPARPSDHRMVIAAVRVGRES